MTKQLYEEALADMKKLKEVAEDNAKRALLEAVTPRIRDLIENQLLGEMEIDELDADLEDLLMDEFPSSPGSVPVMSTTEVGFADVAAAAMSMPDEQGKVTLDLDALKLDSSDEYELSMESANALGILVDENSFFTFENKLRNIQARTIVFTGAGKLVKETKVYITTLSALISEVEDTYSYLQNNMQASLKKDAYETILENHYTTLKKLMDQNMKNKLSTLLEADVTLKLTGMPDDLDLDSLGVDLITGEEDEDEDNEDSGDESDEEGDDFDINYDEPAADEEEESDELDLDDEDESEKKMESRSLKDNMVIEIDEGMLRREISRMKFLRETPTSEDDDLGESALEFTSELDHVDVDDEMEMDKEDTEEGMHAKKQGYMPESLRRRIAAEMNLQVEAKKKAVKAKKLHKEQQTKEKQAKEKQSKAQAKKHQAKLKEAYNFYATKFNESVARCNRLKGMLVVEATSNRAALNGAPKSTAAENNLRNKLAETNLFNAKLLFTNKLLQNESLTKRQKAEVIERLDEAKTEREVKLVYESLVKTLTVSTNKITESTNRGVIGSSSRTARPSSTANTTNEGFEADRWARLAGIVK